MVYDGELVKMESGRWARYQRCDTFTADAPQPRALGLWVAVELEERFQRLLDLAGEALAKYRELGVAVLVKVDPREDGRLMLELGDSIAAPGR